VKTGLMSNVIVSRSDGMHAMQWQTYLTTIWYIPCWSRIWYVPHNASVHCQSLQLMAQLLSKWCGNV